MATLLGAKEAAFIAEMACCGTPAAVEVLVND